MSKIVRQTMKFFGSTAGGNDVGVFGSLKAGSPTYSQVISTIQGLAAWGTGWAAEVTTSGTQANAFALEDMNAFCLVTSYGICYLHEMGIPEWDSATVYYQNSFCQVNGLIYQSLQDSNVNNAPASSPSYWAGAGLVPSGGIIMWSGSIVSIPSGWYLCDGTNGTPNLRDKFIVGAGSAYAVAATGGAATHTHSVPRDGWGDSGPEVVSGRLSVRSDGGGGSVYSAAGDNVTGAGSSLPPYYALAYIMKA